MMTYEEWIKRSAAVSNISGIIYSAMIVGGVLVLGGCSTVEGWFGITTAPTLPTLLYTAEGILYDAALTLDGCIVAKVCTPAQQATGYSYLVKARTAMTTAETDILGCPLAQYVAANASPPTATCPAPTALATTAAADIATAQAAATAAQTSVPAAAPVTQ